MLEVEISFKSLGLQTSLINALIDLNYIKPSPIQIACIPYLLSGRDVLGMAQTGSGKTAAFSLPLLHNINLELTFPQILVLAPTRELAVQVSEAFIEFSKYMKRIKVAALYGGQRYDIQLRALRQGPQVVVGTPGRLLDHLKRGTLNLSRLSGLVLDEADEMLRMGFIEDVENILSKIPKKHQTALFSATMPEAIRRITRRFMNRPKEIKIKSNINTRPNINQSYWKVCGIRKNEALVRFLEAEDFDAVIIFVRTKNATLEVSETLEKNGYNSAALNGDMNQSLREKTLNRLKNGKLDILIATDVAARGLDVDRISFVINYDIPIDSESYIHRIGRTGRAGRKGKALLFVENRERRLLYNIERIMKLHIPEVMLPTIEVLKKRRLAKFSYKIEQQLQSKDIDLYRSLLYKLKPKNNLDMETLAAALLKIAQGERLLILPVEKKIKYRKHKEFKEQNKYFYNKNRRNISNMDLYKINIGKNDGVEVRHIVGTIANKGDFNSKYIGNIKLFDFYSTVELPKGISGDVLSHFSKIRILNKIINIKFIGEAKIRKNYIKNIKNNYRVIKK